MCSLGKTNPLATEMIKVAPISQRRAPHHHHYHNAYLTYPPPEVVLKMLTFYAHSVPGAGGVAYIHMIPTPKPIPGVP